MNMALDEVIKELATLLERNPEMPFAQYMIKLPDRGGMYHLTVTPPGHVPPQETVVTLEKEREGLQGQLTALGPVAANMTALEDGFRQQANAVVEASASLSGVVGRQTQAVTQAALDAKALLTEVGVLAGDIAQLPTQVTAQVEDALSDTKALESFMADVAKLLRQVEKTNNGLHVTIEESLREEYANTIAPVAQSLSGTFSAYEAILQDWAIETRSEAQRSYVDLTTVVDSAVMDLKEVSRVIETLSDQVGEKALLQGRETVAVVAATVAGTIDRVTALQQDIMRHVTGATAASREGTEAVLKRVNDVRVDIAQYLTSDVVDAAEAMRGAIQQLPDHGSLVTRIFALESELGRYRVALDAAERLVHSVKDVPADLLSTQLRDLRNALSEEDES